MTLYPAFIALFGATGTGKTTFVNDASGAGFQVGGKLDSCTKDVAFSNPFYVDERPVYLIDTPGFDDTELSDTEVLKKIAGFLSQTYEQGHKLTGIIYLHRITDLRMTGVSVRNFKTFRELCGADTLSNVLLVTNMWSDPPTEEQVDRETQLRNKHFQKAITQGATLARRPHKDTQSAHDIIRLLLDKNPFVMQIQHELVDRQQNFFDTGAAQVLGAELAEAEQRHEKEMEQMKEDLRTAQEEKDTQTEMEMREALEEAKANSGRVAQEIEALRRGVDEERARWERRIDEANQDRREAEKRQAELMKELEELRCQAKTASEQDKSWCEKRIQELQEKIENLPKPRGCVVM